MRNPTESIPTSSGDSTISGPDAPGSVSIDGNASDPPAPSDGETSDPGGPVPASSGGDVSEMVAPIKAPEPIRTELVAEATPSEGVTVELKSVKAIKTSAKNPGQVVGPALVVEILVKNPGAQPVDTSGVEVSLEDSAGNPASGMIGEPANWFQGSVDPGAEELGVYVFSVAKSKRDTVSVSFTLQPGTPAVVFEGTP